MSNKNNWMQSPFWNGFFTTTYKLRWVYFIGMPIAFILGLILR